MSLTQEYIDEHIDGIHDWNSWGRALFEQLLRAARAKLGDRPAASVELTPLVRVTPVYGPDPRTGKKKAICVRLETTIDGHVTTQTWHNKEWRDQQSK